MSLYCNYFPLKSRMEIIMKQSHWMVLACCFILTACMSSGTSSKYTKSLEEHVAEGHVGHGGGGGR